MDVPEELVMSCAAVLAKAHYHTAYPEYQQIQQFAPLAVSILQAVLESPERLRGLLDGIQ